MDRANVFAVCASLFLVACGASHSQPTAAESAPASWSKDMSIDDKVAFMKAHVVPTMQPVFQQADAKRYQTFGCVTCHGKGKQNPHEFLPKLTLKDGEITAFAEKPEIAKFMATEVVPKMAATFGMAPFDPATKQGFGCGGCHQIVMQ